MLAKEGLNLWKWASNSREEDRKTKAISEQKIGISIIDLHQIKFLQIHILPPKTRQPVTPVYSVIGH